MIDLCPPFQALIPKFLKLFTSLSNATSTEIWPVLNPSSNQLTARLTNSRVERRFFKNLLKNATVSK